MNCPYDQYLIHFPGAKTSSNDHDLERYMYDVQRIYDIYALVDEVEEDPYVCYTSKKRNVNVVEEYIFSQNEITIFRQWVEENSDFLYEVIARIIGEKVCEYIDNLCSGKCDVEKLKTLEYEATSLVISLWIEGRDGIEAA